MHATGVTRACLNLSVIFLIREKPRKAVHRCVKQANCFTPGNAAAAGPIKLKS